jgi:hypothetical protein
VRERERERKHFSTSPTGLIFTKLGVDVMPILMEYFPFCHDINIGLYITVIRQLCKKFVKICEILQISKHLCAHLLVF